MGTPSRQPVSVHGSPASFRTSSTSSTSIPASSSSSIPPISLESALSQHSQAVDPKLAALEQVITDRNTLASQNHQLWKLIEKQRAGYNQILKELERVRIERDSYRAKHTGVAAQSGAKTRPTEKEYPPPLARAHSDGSSPQPDTSAANGKYVPLQVPPRAESLPFPSLNAHDTAPSHSDSLSSFSYVSTATTRPLVYSRKHSIAEDGTSSHAVPSISSDQSQSTGRNISSSHIPRDEENRRLEHLSMSPNELHTTESHHIPSLPLPDRNIMLSRDSRVSIPDEARQYIAAMNDSPVPSPYFKGVTNHPDRRSSSPVNGGSHPDLTLDSSRRRMDGGKADEFLDMSDEDLEEIGKGSGPEDSQDSPIDPPPFTSLPYAVRNPSKPSSASIPSLTSQNITTPEPTLERKTQFSIHTENLPSLQDSTLSTANGEAPPTRQAVFPAQYATQRPVPNVGLGQEPEQKSLPGLIHQSQDASSQPSTTQEQAPVQILAKGTAEVSSGARPSAEADLDDSEQESNFEYQTTLVNDPSSSQGAKSAVIQSSYFRALPLLPSDLPTTTVTVTNSFVRPNDRGKEVLSFVIMIDPRGRLHSNSVDGESFSNYPTSKGRGKDPWRVEKLYSDVLTLEQRVRATVTKNVAKKIANLPEGKVWKDNAPAKVDQRKMLLETYLQALLQLPAKGTEEARNEIIAFFTSDILRDAKQPVMQAGHKEGYLTKRGKNFGGWKTRYFVLSGPVLEYYDCRGGTHLGSIQVAGAQIGRQQPSQRSNSVSDDEKEYRHAFLIVEAKKGPGGHHPRHVLCAESDDDRDSWVEMLVRYFSGSYTEEPIGYGGPSLLGSSTLEHDEDSSRSGTPPLTAGMARGSKTGQSSSTREDTNDDSNSISNHSDSMDLYRGPEIITDNSSSSFTQDRSVEPSPTEHFPLNSNTFVDQHIVKRIVDRGPGQPSSLPDSNSPLANPKLFNDETRSSSELGHYRDMVDVQRTHALPSHSRHHSPEKFKDRKFHHSGYNSSPTSVDRVPSPDKLEPHPTPNGRVKISGPLNGTPIPAGYKFGKDATASHTSQNAEASTPSDRREKAKSRSFWGFGQNKEKSHPITYVPRAVFGVTLEESLDVSSIANLPSIVFRCIQYLEAKKADQEEGIYRLSGSSAVIKSLKDRFNTEGDVDLLASDEFWDPHAIAGLLKSFLRELPSSILTRDLHLRFLAVIDILDPQERIRELSHLIAALPIANYSLLRALTAHLILIVQNSSVNKMTMRNVGIVFSPTLGIPAGVFSLMLGEFNRVFNVDGISQDEVTLVDEKRDEGNANTRNSRQYSDAAADQLLGLAGRTLTASADDGEDVSLDGDQSSQTTDFEGIVETNEAKSSKASLAASSRGLTVNVPQALQSQRQSKLAGLPSSPRPFVSQSHTTKEGSPPPS